MKHCLLAMLGMFMLSSLCSQYYLRGEVKDEMGRYLEGAKIILSSNGTYPYASGSSGSFGIPSSLAIDTITVSFDGYEILRTAVDTRLYQVLVLKMLPETAGLLKNKLTSRTRNLVTTDEESYFSAMGESYSTLIENEFVDARRYPETGFSLSIDRASYSNIRRFLNNDIYVPTDAVRIEEMLNYFDLRGNEKKTDTENFTSHTTITSCPWNNNNQLLFIQLQAPKINLDTIPPNNLVFLIDVSGSMDKPVRLPLLQAAFKLLVENLRTKDIVSIVTYGGGVHIALAPTNGSDKTKINNIIDSLYADGDTPGENAIRTAYDIAKHSFIKNGNNRIILATDGDFNVGQTSEKDLEDLVTYQKQSGIYLTCLGVGMGNYKDSKLETLAKKGNGNFAYLDNIREAEKVLITEFTKTMYAVANDAYANISFNPDIIKSYRLIGFDNKKEAISNTASKIDGGEVGSGHNLMAIFEVTPNKKLKGSDSITANIALQYKLPKNDSLVCQQFTVPYHPINIDEADNNLRFATSVVMFGTLLKQSKFAKNYSYEDVVNMAKSSSDPTNRLQQEFISLVQKADKIYTHKKRRR